MNAGYSQICISLLIKLEKITSQFWKIYVFSTEKDHFYGTNLVVQKSLPCKMITIMINLQHLTGLVFPVFMMGDSDPCIKKWDSAWFWHVCIAGLAKSGWQLHQRAVYWLDEDSPICIQWSQQPRWRFPRNSNCQGKILIKIVKVKFW